jgi:hypothetical protein
MNQYLITQTHSMDPICITCELRNICETAIGPHRYLSSACLLPLRELYLPDISTQPIEDGPAEMAAQAVNGGLIMN